MATATAKKNGKVKNQVVSIPEPKLLEVKIPIRGVSPLVQHKFSAKARAKIRESQEAGHTGRGKKVREPKDFESLYREAQHISSEGWNGIPCPAFRSAMISACRLVGFVMTRAKLSFKCLPDGFSRDDGTPLVKITHGKPEPMENYVRNETGVVDLRCRPIWHEWAATVRIQYDADQFSLPDIINLLHRAGLQVGVGEGRPDSKKSNGMGWGCFEVVHKEVS